MLEQWQYFEMVKSSARNTVYSLAQNAAEQMPNTTLLSPPKPNHLSAGMATGQLVPRVQHFIFIA